MRGQGFAVGLVLLALVQPLDSAAQNAAVGQASGLSEVRQGGSLPYAAPPYEGQQAVYHVPLAPVGPAAAGVPAPSASLPPRRVLPPRAAPAGTRLAPVAGNVSSAAKPALPSLITLGGSLALVLGLFFAVAWLLKKTVPGNSSLLPKEVFEILGRAPLASRQQVHLVRCGRKLLLLSASPAGLETLAEIDDPVEVDRLAGLCVQAQPGSATAAFRQVFQQFAAPAPATADRLGARHG